MKTIQILAAILLLTIWILLMLPFLVLGFVYDAACGGFTFARQTVRWAIDLN